MSLLTRRPAEPSLEADRSGDRLPALVGLAAGLLVVGVAAWGAALSARGVHLHLAGGQPLTGRFAPRLPALTVLPVAVGIALVAGAPWAAARWPWRRLAVGSGVAAAVWAVALALVDGPGALAAPLTTEWEYLRDVPRVGALGPFLHGFTDHVLGGSPGFQWVTHVSGHPPGALLVFAALDRVGLHGGGWAAALCIAAGASAVPAVLGTTRILGGEPLARRAAPFLVLAPTALWVATSADAMFSGVACWGVFALAGAASRRGPGADALAVAGGLLLGGLLFLSYGLALVGVLAVTAVVAQHRVRPLVIGGLAVLAVVAAFAAGGFWWYDGFVVASARVREGPAWIERPTAYFLVADLAAVALCAGPAALGGLAVTLRSRRRAVIAAAVMPLAAAGTIVLAVATNLAKGEVERIFLPFTIWLLVAAAGLPAARARIWLAVQLLVALGIQLGWMLKW